MKPTNEELEMAQAVCDKLADYVEETEPYAKISIAALREAASLLAGTIE